LLSVTLRWTAILMLGGCTQPYLGISLRFQRGDIATFLGEVRAIGIQFGFSDEIAWEKEPDWEILLKMRGNKIVRREPLLLTVKVERGRLSAVVGRFGGMGSGLRPEEVAVIRSMCAQLEALGGFASVEQEVGMQLASGQGNGPNKPPDRMPGTNAQGKSGGH